MQPTGPVYRLLRQPLPPPPAPALDADQQAVVEHAGGPLLVLAGPGTGKTTTLVESVVHQIRGGLDPDQVLVLTFGRKAANSLRERVSARLGRTSSAPLAFTFHSFCYALLRGEYDRPAPDPYAAPVRLLSGPEQEVAVAEMLRHSLREPTPRWPEQLRGCLSMRGFAQEVRAVIARTRELGLDPEDLLAFAQAEGRADWAAAARFLADYLDVLDARGAIDYTELVHRSVLLAERPEVRDRLRQRFRAVFVDEYQDTDSAQLRLLRALAGDGRHLVVFGDPDQSIYAFRGADVTGILDFREQFPQLDGSPSPLTALRTCHRAGAELLTVSRQVGRRMPLSRLPAEAVRLHRELLPARPEPDPTDRPYTAGAAVLVRTYPTPGAEVDAVADLLRRAHLEDGLAWGEMAVLVRSGSRSIPLLRRVLTAAGVPLEVAGDELPLREEPAVRVLLDALRIALDPGLLTAERAEALLRSPLAGLDATDLRRLGRALRAEERQAYAGTEDEAPWPQEPGSPTEPAEPEDWPDPGEAAALGQPAEPAPPERRSPRPAAELIRQALAEPQRLVAIEDDRHGAAARAYQLGMLLRRVRDLVTGEDSTAVSAEQALWEVWTGSRWPERLAQASRRGGPAGRRADRDLDAVCEAFNAASRSYQRVGAIGVANFLAELDAQYIPGDLLSENAVRGEAVRLVTAHRAKGLQWRLVVVAGVQEGVWPDMRRRGSLLEADRIGPEGLLDPLSLASVLAEERRLFYVATTRANERLVVTAVASAHDDGDQPSRFLDELGTEPVHVTERPRRPLSVTGLVAELRAALIDPATSPALRHAAARRLASLATERDGEGWPLVPIAHPRRWWGLAELTENPTAPVHDPTLPVPLSASAVQGLAECPLKWFLARQVHAESARTSALAFGSVLHVLADEVAHERAPAELAALMDRLDQVWDQLAFDAPFQSVQQKEEARAALARFLRWHTSERGRRVVATEQRFDVRIEVGEVRISVRGFMDRVEADEAGHAYVVDFKTGRTKPTEQEVLDHPQLALYQLAVDAGALEEAPDLDRHFHGQRPTSGGAELVHLRLETGEGQPAVQTQAPIPADETGSTWIERLLAQAAHRVLDETFEPTVSTSCDRCEFRGCCTARPEGRQVIE